MSISEEQLARWAKAPSETEEGKSRVAVDRITKAIKAEFGSRVRIFLQGSYKNRTNVRLDSDVDMVVCYTNVYYYDTMSLSDESKSLFKSLSTTSDYKFSQFRTKIESILREEFGYGDVDPKEKCINIKGNSCRVNADVVPAFVHKRLKTGYPNDAHTEGIEFVTSTGDRVLSFPDHHYENGKWKNNETKEMYRPIVRILKNIRNELVEKGELTTKDVPSFSIECLVWNVLPHSHFQSSSYRAATKKVIAKVWNDMRNSEKAKTYTEVSGLLNLFPPPNKITPQQSEVFMEKAWNHL